MKKAWDDETTPILDSVENVEDKLKVAQDIEKRMHFYQKEKLRLSDRLTILKFRVNKLINMFEKTEVSSEGNEFHPVKIVTCRSASMDKITQAVNDIKEVSK